MLITAAYSNELSLSGAAEDFGTFMGGLLCVIKRPSAGARVDGAEEVPVRAVE
jgi:hypothetical protein